MVSEVEFAQKLHYTPNMAAKFGPWSETSIIPRLLSLPHEHHILLFGPRNCGKSTLLKNTFDSAHYLYIDLLEQEELERFSNQPDSLYDIVIKLPQTITHVIIDEIQKIPALLDVVHRSMASTHVKFIMTGSSARKLKLGGANLLAGRAFVYHLYPFSYFELHEKFNLEDALRWGTLPEIFLWDDDRNKQKFLQSYTQTYLKEEVWGEHHIRKLAPFRRFLEVAAQYNGKIINYSKIARDVGVDDKTVQNYYSILEDTLVGFFLDPYHNSVRKRLSQSPKFYFFDPGVVRALSQLASIPLLSQTTAYGNAFEHYIILEFIRLDKYFDTDFRFTYLRTRNDVEIDLIIERPGKPLLCIEIKSHDNITESHIKPFIAITNDFENCEAIVLCRDKYPKKIQHVSIYPWQQGLKLIFDHHLP